MNTTYKPNFKQYWMPRLRFKDYRSNIFPKYKSLIVRAIEEKDECVFWVIFNESLYNFERIPAKSLHLMSE